MRSLIIFAILSLPSCNDCEEKAEAPIEKDSNILNGDDHHIKAPTPIVIISDSTPDPYRHPTTHPESTYEELGLDGGHGDGVASVNFVGKVVFVANDGNLQPVSNVKFLRSADNLGSVGEERELLQFTSDAYGDFEATLQVFAASACRQGGDLNDWHVYQTGSAIIDVVAEGFETRRANIRFEQPSTLIVLKKKN